LPTTCRASGIWRARTARHSAAAAVSRAAVAASNAAPPCHVKIAPGHLASEHPDLVAELRRHRHEVTAFLSGWPPEAADYEHRFAQPHAKLFALLGREVSAF
jgi:hypothetical protein